jgi:hypothetical protein
MPRWAKRNKRKACECENYRDGGICDSPTESNSEDLLQWENESYFKVLNIKVYMGYYNLSEGEER